MHLICIKRESRKIVSVHRLNTRSNTCTSIPSSDPENKTKENNQLVTVCWIWNHYHSPYFLAKNFHFTKIFFQYKGLDIKLTVFLLSDENIVPWNDHDNSFHKIYGEW